MLYGNLKMTQTNQLTAETITASQIRQLRAEALACPVSDTRMIDICDVALADHETANDDGDPMVDPDGDPITRTEARALCADAINDARAMDDSRVTA